LRLGFGFRITLVAKEQWHVLIEFGSPAVDHRSGDAVFLTHRLNRRIPLQALQHDFRFEFGCILLPLLGCHLFRYLSREHLLPYPLVHYSRYRTHGTITFYNASTQQQIVDAGTLLVGRDGEQIITDQTAYIPAGTLNTNGSVGVWAHAIDYGPAGNIAADDIYGACCRLLVQAVNCQFTGGHNAKDYPLVTKTDIATATSNLLAQVQAEFSLHHENLSPGETLVTPVPCITHTTSNHRTGDEAAQVTVTVSQFCSPSAYKPRDVQSSLIRLVAGKTKQDAISALLRLPGVSSVAISWADDMKLPPAMYIHLDILVS